MKIDKNKKKSDINIQMINFELKIIKKQSIHKFILNSYYINNNVIEY